jgi:hypothetical protein
MVMDAIRLAGVTPTATGFDIAPHLPFDGFSLRLTRIGIASEPGRYRGYVRPEGSGRIELAVHLPAGVDPATVTAWAGTTAVPLQAEGGVVRFSVRGRAGRATDWAVTWTP